MVAISDSLWPLVIAFDRGGTLFELSNTLRALATRGQFCLLFEPRPEPRPAYEHREFFRNIHRDVSGAVHSAAILVRTNLAKNVAIAHSAHRAGPNRRFFATSHAAAGWCRETVFKAFGTKHRQRNILSELEALRAGPVMMRQEIGSPSRAATDDIPILLSAFREPAFLADTDGNICHQNRAASLSDFDERWVSAAVDKAAEPSETNARVFPLRYGDRRIVIPVLPWEIPEAFTGLADVWPKRLRQTVHLLLQGRSDKEVAEALGTKLSTARTYIVRTFRRLGVQSRKDLLSFAMRFGPPTRRP